MACLPILRWPDPRLSAVCAPVRDAGDVATLAADMLDTMYAAPGRGLAAPQVGVLKRLFVMDVAWRSGPPEPLVCINPRVTWRSTTVAEGPEGCLSIPGLSLPVRRAVEARLDWTDLSGARRKSVLTGFAAICAQHELDHLDGLVTLDHLPPDARAAALAGYAA